MFLVITAAGSLCWRSGALYHMKFRKRDSTTHNHRWSSNVILLTQNKFPFSYCCISVAVSQVLLQYNSNQDHSKQLLVQIHSRSSIVMASSKPAPISSPLTLQSQRTFHKFPELATELRLQIWEHAVPGPRIVHLTYDLIQPIYCLRVRSDADINTMAFFDIMPEDQYPRVFDPEIFWGIRSHCPPPGLLGACRESFSVASKYYDRVFGTERGIAQTSFDFDRDFLYIDWHSNLGPHPHNFVKSELARVQNIVINFGGFYEMGNFRDRPLLQPGWERSLAIFLRDFSGLRNIIMNNGDDIYNDCVTELQFGDEEALEPLFKDPHRWIYQLAGKLRNRGNTRAADILEAYRHNRQVSLDTKMFEKLREIVKRSGTGPLPPLSISWKRVATPEQLEVYRLVTELWIEEMCERANHNYRLPCGHLCPSSVQPSDHCTCGSMTYATTLEKGEQCPCGYRDMEAGFKETCFSW